MKKLLLFSLLIIISYSKSQAQCGNAYEAEPIDKTQRFYYTTNTLLSGDQPNPIIPSSIYYSFKFELIATDGYVLKTVNMNTNSYDRSYSNGYLYFISWYENENCAYNGEHGSTIALRVTKVLYKSWFFGGFIQESMLPLGSEVCATSRFASRLPCGNTSNPNSKPNLTLSGFKVKVGSTTYDATATTNSTPIFKYGENHTFTLTINNNDNGDAASSNYKLLVSEEAKYPSIGTKPVYEYRIGNAGAISANSEKTVTFSEYFYDNISSLNLENDKTYYMIVDVDYNNNVNNESNESITDNVKYIPFKYTKPATGKIALKIDSNGSTLDIDYEFTSDTNYLRLQNIWYTQLNYLRTLHGLTPTVDVSHLYDGVYALYINNTFVKKIGLTTGRTYTGGPSPHEP